MDLARRRREYQSVGIDAPDMHPDPIVQFRRWLTEAQEADLLESEALTVSSVDADGAPSTRYVLLRGLDERGFVFFTNYASAKARHLERNPRVALTWGWLELHRQVRVSGIAERLPAAESDAYFATRPRGAQVGAWASPQSRVLSSRSELERLVAEVEERFAGTEIPRPDGWGGYLVRPVAIEFWQGRPNRLHDRLRYRREEEAVPAKSATGGEPAGRDRGWTLERLAP